MMMNDLEAACGAGQVGFASRRVLFQEHQVVLMNDQLLQTIGAVTYFIMLTGLSCYGLHRFWMLYLYYRHRHDRPQPAGQWTGLPRVTIQLPIFNEKFVVDRLLDAVANIDYPRGKLQIQVLDDSTDDTVDITARKVEQLKADGFDIQHVRRANRRGFKAGALQEAMPQVTGEFIAIFDADFVPSPGWLRQVMPYFTDAGVGMVQTRWSHINERFSLLTRIQAILLDGHFVIEHAARSRSGRFFNFNGTAGIWRRESIEDAGGWEADTLAEDMDLSYRAQIKGWRFVYLSDVTTPAELPVEINAFKAQQHRWAKGSAQTARKVLPLLWRSNVPLKVKIEGTIHLTSNLGYIMLFMLCLAFHAQLTARHLFHGWSLPAKMFLVDLPFFTAATLSVIAFYVCGQKELHRDWWKKLFVIPALMITGIGLCVNNARAVVEGLCKHQSEFVRTPKLGVGARPATTASVSYRAWRGIVPFVELALGAYFTLMLLEVIALRQWSVVPFITIFQFGFIGVGLLSLFQAPVDRWLALAGMRLTGWFNSRSSLPGDE
jgi:cellulose synthase/poly-beta-1,6-N-acetylglucosamine synthase-like glycosyltransferase